MADFGYIWDEHKAFLAQSDHGVSYLEAVQACEDEMHLVGEDPQGHAGRFLVAGRTGAGRILQVICSEEELPVVRLITAFDAQDYWRRLYEQS